MESNNFLLFSDAQVLQELGRRVNLYRLGRRIPDKQIFAKGGVTKQALAKFKKGRNISLLNFIKILRGTGLLSALAQTITPTEHFSPINFVNSSQTHLPQRIRTPKSEKKKFKWGDE